MLLFMDPYYDRFIPDRISTITPLARAKLSTPDSSLNDASPIGNTPYQDALCRVLFGKTIEEAQNEPLLKMNHRRRISTLETAATQKNSPRSVYQLKLLEDLEAPEISNDIYSHLLSWSESKQLALGLKHKLLSYDFTTKQVTRLTNFGIFDRVKAVQWIDGSHLVAGSDANELVFVDAMTQQRYRELHLAHNITLFEKWENRKDFLFADEIGVCHLYDTRQSKSHRVTKNNASITTLKTFGGNLMAIGLSNNNISVVDLRKGAIPLATLKGHQAAVTALTFYDQHCIVSGGGYDDQTIKIWDLRSFKEYQSIPTDSQVCNLHLTHHKILISTHGFESNEIRVWQISEGSIRLIQTLTGHKDRVLYSTLSPDQKYLATASPDESLKIWDLAATPA